MANKWSLDEVTKRAKKEILDDMASGIVPASVSSYSELHDYVDANGYGGAFEDEAPTADLDLWNDMQEAVNDWLKTRSVQLKKFQEKLQKELDKIHCL